MGISTIIPVVHPAMDYCNEEIVLRLADGYGWSHEEASAIFEETKSFLVKCATISGKHVPTKREDAGWHTFLLSTKDYRVFCKRYFGRFIDHVPTPIADCENNEGIKRMVNALSLCTSDQGGSQDGGGGSCNSDGTGG